MGVKKRGVQGGHPPIGAQPRHCERSEAIHSAASGEVDCFAALAMTAERACAFSRRDAPEVCYSLCPRKSEGAGKTGCLLHPRSRVRFAQTKVHTSIQGSGSLPAFPAQWLYGLLRALPGERLFCLRRGRDTSRQLSASTAAPEPHDFAVRFRRVRLAPSASTASHRTFVTMANAPHPP